MPDSTTLATGLDWLQHCARVGNRGAAAVLARYTMLELIAGQLGADLLATARLIEQSAALLATLTAAPGAVTPVTAAHVTDLLHAAVAAPAAVPAGPCSAQGGCQGAGARPPDTETDEVGAALVAALPATATGDEHENGLYRSEIVASLTQEATQ